MQRNARVNYTRETVDLIMKKICKILQNPSRSSFTNHFLHFIRKRNVRDLHGSEFSAECIRDLKNPFGNVFQHNNKINRPSTLLYQ